MPDLSRAGRVAAAVYFTCVGVTFFAWWIWADPSHEGSDSMQEWRYVLAFSGVLLVLGVAVPLWACVVGDARVVRAALVVAGSLLFSSLANVVEDGLGVDAAFFGFILGLLVTNVGLVVVAVMLARRGSRWRRLLAFVPLGTLLAIILAVEVGGPLMLATWLGAAGIATFLPPHGPPTARSLLAGCLAV
jgi:hypothetical protein